MDYDEEKKNFIKKRWAISKYYRQLCAQHHGIHSKNKNIESQR